MIFRPSVWRTRRRIGERYRAVADQLVSAAARTAGATHVVDSAHYPLRASELAHLQHCELYLLFLVRDPQAVVASFRRTDVPERSYGLLAANAYLWLTYLLCTWVFLRQPRARRLLVRHEKLLADPHGVLDAILRAVGAGAAPADLSALRTGPVFQANRLVRHEIVALRAPGETHARGSLVTAVMQAPWRALFRLLGPVAGAGGRAREQPVAERSAQP